MAFYDLPKPEREKRVAQIHSELLDDLRHDKNSNFLKYFSDEDTYIRKAAYSSVGNITKNEKYPIGKIVPFLQTLLNNPDEKIRQTVVNAAGEIAMFDFQSVVAILERGLNDTHHKVRNAVVGSLKKATERNPGPALAFARQYLHHPDPEIRRQICHGIELRGRKHPEEVLPLLKELEFDSTPRVKKMLVHVLGQISYKTGCLAKVVAHLKTWQNEEIVRKALEEIVEVHREYEKFAAIPVETVKALITMEFEKYRQGN